MKRRFHYLRTKALLASMSLLYACGPTTIYKHEEKRDPAVVPATPKMGGGVGGVIYP